MILNKTGYSYQDLTIVPKTITDIDHRSQCNPFVENNKLPIFASPMSTITNEKNINIWKNNGIMPIIPRNIDYTTRVNKMDEGEWVALSLNEFKQLFITGIETTDKEIIKNKTYKVCVDLANGHMRSLYETINKAKELSREYGYTLIIMTGNIANPETYRWICENAEVDYIRVSIGTGNNCFVDGTKITMSNGEKKNIEDICIGDKVFTIDGSEQKVENTLRFKTSKKLIKINNEITSTEDHKYFVINESDKNLVNENNLEEYGYWIEANKLDKNMHLLVKLYKINEYDIFDINNKWRGYSQDTEENIKKMCLENNCTYKKISNKIEFIEIKNIEYIDKEEIVNDLTVSNNHTYIANDYIVHNCITSTQTSIHYPIATLIDECYQYKKNIKEDIDNRYAGNYFIDDYYIDTNTVHQRTVLKSCPYIVADGGIRGYADVIKALGLGADYVMIGSLFTGLLESAAPLDIECYNSHYKYVFKEDGIVNNGISDILSIWGDADEVYKREFIHDMKSITKESYGMSTKKAQMLINPNAKTKTSEGCTKYIQVKETVLQWTDNMIAYLKSAMSYTNKQTLDEFRGNVNFIINSSCAILAVNK